MGPVPGEVRTINLPDIGELVLLGMSLVRVRDAFEDHWSPFDTSHMWGDFRRLQHGEGGFPQLHGLDDSDDGKLHNVHQFPIMIGTVHV